MNTNYGKYFEAGKLPGAISNALNERFVNSNNSYYLSNNNIKTANKTLLNKMKNAFKIGPFGLTSRIQSVLRTNMSTDEKIKAIKLLLRGNKRRSAQNKLKLVTEVLNSNFSKNANVRAAIVNYLSSGNGNAVPAATTIAAPVTRTGFFTGRKTRFEEILASQNRNSRSKAQELSFLLRSDPTNLNKKARLIGNAKNLAPNNRDDLFDLITTLKEEQIENRRKTSRSRMSLSNLLSGSSTSTGNGQIGFQKQIPYTGNGGPVFGGARNTRRVEYSSGFGRNNGGLGGNGLPRNNGGLPRNNVGLPRNNGGLPRNNGGLPRNYGGPANFFEPGTPKKRCRSVKMKLLKGVVSDVKKNKLVTQVRKLGKKDAKKQKKDELVKFIIRRIRPPVPKKKKKRVQAPIKENQPLIFKNNLQVNGLGAGNQGVRPPNVRNTTRNGFIP